MSEDQERLLIFRSIMEKVWKTPTAADAVRFVYQELGEADSQAMKLGYQDKNYLRTNLSVGAEAQRKLELELGQAYMMMLTYASILGVDLSDALTLAMQDRLQTCQASLPDVLYEMACQRVNEQDAVDTQAVD